MSYFHDQVVLDKLDQELKLLTPLNSFCQYCLKIVKNGNDYHFICRQEIKNYSSDIPVSCLCLVCKNPFNCNIHFWAHSTCWDQLSSNHQFFIRVHNYVRKLQMSKNDHICDPTENRYLPDIIRYLEEQRDLPVEL